jgi:hypothetical protein
VDPVARFLLLSVLAILVPVVISFYQLAEALLPLAAQFRSRLV